jgi:glyoxylase-like metal-dependent hydrolase (beta-lactamase superfamily II)
METPGHTRQDITTLVTIEDGTAALTHLWWRHDSELDPLAWDAGALHHNRERVLERSTLIVPGHGEPFPATDETPR